MATPTKEHQANVLINLAILKLFSDQSCYIIGELPREKKHWFNTTVRAADNFIKEVESGLSDHNKETLQILTDSLNNGIADLKNDLLKHIS